ncbi:MAG: hypothetical protein JST92_15090 [Deltaproteobacteria bacterium]|nr:hypothetical protein [Deltaproteobacteria bacterium]
MPGVLLLVLAVALVLAVVFFLQARGNGVALLAVRKELEDLKKAGEGDRAKVKELESELKTKGQHLVEAREKLADARKKSSESKPKLQTQSRGAREAELEEDLQHSRQLTDEAHAAEEKARKEASAAKAELAAAKSELTRAQEKVRELSAQAAGKPVVAAVAAAPGAQDELVKRLENEKRAAEREQRELQDALRAAKDKEMALKDEIRKAKGRADTNNRVYLVTKSDLELSQERLAQAERRLWQAGITLPKPEAKPRPKATGPASADHPRVAPPTPAGNPVATPAVTPKADLAPAQQNLSVSQPAEPKAETAAVIAAAVESGPQAVEPLRRRAKEELKN